MSKSEIDEVNDTCNEITKVIVKNFQSFLKGHMAELPMLLRGFVFHELAKYAYVHSMVNAHQMSLQVSEIGSVADLDGLLRACKKKFDDDVEQAYEDYLKKEMN